MRTREQIESTASIIRDLTLLGIPAAVTCAAHKYIQEARDMDASTKTTSDLKNKIKRDFALTITITGVGVAFYTLIQLFSALIKEWEHLLPHQKVIVGTVAAAGLLCIGAGIFYSGKEENNLITGASFIAGNFALIGARRAATLFAHGNEPRDTTYTAFPGAAPADLLLRP